MSVSSETAPTATTARGTPPSLLPCSARADATYTQTPPSSRSAWTREYPTATSADPGRRYTVWAHTTVRLADLWTRRVTLRAPETTYEASAPVGSRDL